MSGMDAAASPKSITALRNQNGMDAIAMHGTVTSDLTWVNPSDSSSTTAHTLGYMVAGGDGLLTVQRKTLTVPAGGVVKVAGALTINNGRLEASAGNAVFTSLDDNGPAGITQACPSIFFTSCPSPLGGSEWSGITLRGDATGPASALFDHATVAHGSTAVSISDNGWNFGSSNLGLIVRNGSLIQNGSSDGIVAIDTPLLIDHSTVSGLGAHGISASFLVTWESALRCLPPVVEAVMISTASTQGISFVSQARIVEGKR